jgi:hypothetical protein
MIVYALLLLLLIWQMNLYIYFQETTFINICNIFSKNAN